MDYIEARHLALTAFRDSGPYGERLELVQQRLDRIMALPSFLRLRMQTQVAKLMREKETLCALARQHAVDGRRWIAESCEA